MSSGETISEAVSIVIPAFNEAKNLPALHAEILKVCREHGYTFEIIIVDDGSSDGTREVVRRLGGGRAAAQALKQGHSRRGLLAQGVPRRVLSGRGALRRDAPLYPGATEDQGLSRG